MAHILLSHSLSLSLSLPLSLNKALAQLRATAAGVNGSSLGFLLRCAYSYLLHYKAEVKSKELIPGIKKYVLDDFRSFNQSLNQECNGSQLQVAILLCTHQGQRFLADEIESFKKRIQIFDGSIKFDLAQARPAFFL
jgi:hypothetical protein